MCAHLETKLSAEDIQFDAGEARIRWWAGRRAQFPNLSSLARDILSIPGAFPLPAFKYYSDVFPKPQQ